MGTKMPFKSTVYLETSFVSALVSKKTDAASVYQSMASKDWWSKQAANYSVYASQEVLDELAHPGHTQSAEALRTIRTVPLLAITDEVRGFAELLVREKTMPRPASGDALHVALATVYGVDYVLTWNVRHLANPNKLRHYEWICRRSALIPTRFVTPEFLWETKK